MDEFGPLGLDDQKAKENIKREMKEEGGRERRRRPPANGVWFSSRPRGE